MAQRQNVGAAGDLLTEDTDELIERKTREHARFIKEKAEQFRRQRQGSTTATRSTSSTRSVAAPLTAEARQILAETERYLAGEPMRRAYASWNDPAAIRAREISTRRAIIATATAAGRLDIVAKMEDHLAAMDLDPEDIEACRLMAMRPATYLDIKKSSSLFKEATK